jgi:hypothetical protein
MPPLLEALGLVPIANGAMPPPPTATIAPPPPSSPTTTTTAPPTNGTDGTNATSGTTGTPTATTAPLVSVQTQLGEIDTALADSKTDIAALKIAPLRNALGKELAELKTARGKVDKLAETAKPGVAGPLAGKAKDFRKRVGELLAAAPDIVAHQKTWAIDPVGVLDKLVAKQKGEAKTIMAPRVAALKKRLNDLKKAVETGDFKNANAISEEVFFAAAGATRAVNEFSADFPAYKVERDKAAAAIKGLKSHKQAKQIAAEIADLERKLVQCDAVASRAELKGWEKATAAVKVLPELCARARKLADDLATVAAKAPDLKKKLKAAGADSKALDKMVGYAQKMLVEEKCSDEQAVKMAQDAQGFVKAGLDETDALVSSRVKAALVADGTSEDVAQEIGKNLRVAGTSTADDAKAVGAGLKKFPKKVLEELNKAGIQTECCRGPVTEAMPELKGVLPRGWPEGSTWDSVPGVYSGSVKKVVVGTMEKDGKRHVPEQGEGPIPHGTPDLIGHEGGHAFDVSDGDKKSANADFLAARQEDIDTGNPDGMWGPRDNYFLTTAEGGTNDAGSTSETFAESFAMHTGGNSRWPKLEAFWTANPWGV